MRGLRRTLSFLVFVLPLTALFVASFVAIRRYYGTAERDLAPALAAELTHALGHEVRVGRVVIEGRRARVFDVRMAEGPTFRDHSGREMASAREVDLDIDLRNILLEKNPRIPLFASAHVIAPRAYAARNSAGKWNFADLFQPRKVKPARPGIGEVTIRGGDLTYVDAAAPRHAKRPPMPLAARFVEVDGSLQFNPDDTVTWTADGREVTGLAEKAAIVGSYEPKPDRLYLRIDAARVSAAAASRFLPPGNTVLAGRVSGRLTLLQGSGQPIAYQADATLDQVALAADRVREPVTGVTGSATVSNGLITARLDGQFAGSPVHAEGRILGPEHKFLDAWLSGPRLPAKRLAAAFDLLKRYPDLRQIDANANAVVSVRGLLDHPDQLAVAATGSVRASGLFAGKVRVPVPATVQVSFSGTPQAPIVYLYGNIPEAHYGRYAARSLRVSGSFGGDTLTADFSGTIAGGTAAGRARIRGLQASTSHARYAANLRLRGVRLQDIPFRPADSRRASGAVNADLTASGKAGDTVPAGSALVSVSGLKYDAWAADRAAASVRSNGTTVYIDSLAASGPQGTLTAHGNIQVSTKKLNLHVEADEVDIASLPVVPRLADGAPQIGGVAYLREGRVSGDMRDPRFAGLLRAYDLQSGSRLHLDYVSANLRGSREQVDIRDGQAWRFPAFATVEGILAQPFSKRAQVDLTGAFEKAEMQDLADLAGSELAASGVARGTWSAEGYLNRPVVRAMNIHVAEPAIGEYAFDSLTASLIYDAASGEPVVRLPEFRAVTRGAAITGSATLRADQTFSAHAESQNVNLDMLGPYVPDFLFLTGMADAQTDITGALRGGKVEDLRGRVEGKTTGLQLNGERFGELSGTVFLSGSRITGRNLALGTPGSGVTLDSLDYDRETSMIASTGRVNHILLDRLRQAALNSPALIKNPDNFIAARVRPITSPFEGAVNASFTVSGTTADPEAALQWNGESMVIAEQPIQEFRGRAVLRRDLIRIEDARLFANPTVVTASGSYVPDRSIDGELDINSLPLAVLKRWFPDSSLLFKSGDIVRAAEFVRRVRDAQDPLTVYFRAQLAQSTIEQLAAYAGGRPSAALLQALVGELNSLVRQGRSLYTPERFAGVALTAETRALVERKPTGRALARMNRLLISEAYSSELVQGIGERPMLEGLSGMADKVNIVAAGNPSAPMLTTTIELSGTTWIDPDGQVLGGRPIHFDLINTSPVTIGNGRIQVADIAIKVAEPAPPGPESAARPGVPAPRTARAPVTVDPSSASPEGAAKAAAAADTVPDSAPRGPYEAHLRDVSLGFSWESLGPIPDAPAAFTLSIDRQGLGIFSALAGSAPRVMQGTVTALMQYRGPLRDLYSRENPDELAPASRPRLAGNVTIDAPRIGFHGLSTELRDLHTKLSFTGDRLRVESFTARTQVVNPRNSSRPSDPLTITGELPINGTGAAAGLKVTAPRLVFGEAPLPGIGTGAAAGELSTRPSPKTESGDLTISGTLFRPLVAGTVYIRQAAVRLPETFEAQTPAGFALPFLPAFNLKFVAGANARISTAQLNAFVRTSTSDPLELTGPITDPRFNGTLVIDRGTLTFPTARFAIQRGGAITLKYPSTPAGGFLEKQLAINVNLTATTRLTAASVNGIQKRYTVTVEARGPINAGAPLSIYDSSDSSNQPGLLASRGLRLTFRSDPADLALSSQGLQRRITGLLGGQSAIEELFSRNPNVARVIGEQAADIFSASVLPGLFERTGIGRALGFDEFAVEYNRLDAFTLRVSRQLAGPLYLSYWRRLSGANLAGASDRAAWEFKLSYRIQDNLQFSWTIDEQRTNAYLLEGVFRF